MNMRHNKMAYVEIKQLLFRLAPQNPAMATINITIPKVVEKY